ncbi:MAG: RecQ family ATP-dependent DNA helicase [Saprospiraceae bacterium]|nr:RecQ family ATP-dependent DNA helicase [Saprospiraceae bacterium]
MSVSPQDVLKKYWGYDQFRPLQSDIIQSVLDGADTLALMPTGGGKSICFQVPALCREGICIVVSPLIALMKDQVYNLQKRNVPAVAIYSGMAYQDIDRILDNCAYGNTKFLYLSPERLTTDLAKARIRRMKVNLLAIDEAHCVSQWGYDFRPPYLEIAQIREWLPDVPVLALTATATKQVVDDIQEKLAFRKSNVFQKSFTRDNLSYAVLHEDNKLEKLADILTRVRGSGVVYVRSRKKTKDIADFLKQRGISADFYNAGLSAEIRSAKQDAWIANKVRVMVSTNAFGMGIDKPDVRIVVHMDLPDSIEAYYQEAGRAGRDEKKAYAVLLYNDNDRRSLEEQYEIAFPEIEEIRQVYRALGSYLQLAIGSGEGEGYDFDMTEFCKNYSFKAIKVLSCLKVLEQAGWIVLSEAVLIPSTLRILVTKEELYDYLLRHPKLDRIIKAILRTYQGAFLNEINVREGQLANFLNLSKGDLDKALNLLHKDRIVDYKRQKEKPQLVFTKERVDASVLDIDRQLYAFRKNRHLERIRKAVAYAETPTCRNRQLLHYFGQETDKNCGICDVCTGRTRTDISTDQFNTYRDWIQQVLQAGPLSMEQLVKSFPPAQEEKVLTAVGYLVDEGYLEEEEGTLRWRKP